MGEFILAIFVDPSAQNSGSVLTTIPFLLAIFAVMYFLIIRPQTKKQNEHKEMINTLKKGDKIVTAGGIIGDIVRIDEDIVILKVADNVKMKFQRQSISTLVESKEKTDKK